MATKNGITKKTNLGDYANATRESGLRGIKLEEGDTLIGCVLTNGENEVVLVSAKGRAVRFVEGDLRDQGRDTVGVTGMRFKYEGDFVKSIEVCDQEARLLVAREDGIGKRTPFDDYRLISRGGTGVIAIDLPGTLLSSHCSTWLVLASDTLVRKPRSRPRAMTATPASTSTPRPRRNQASAPRPRFSKAKTPLPAFRAMPSAVAAPAA